MADPIPPQPPADLLKDFKGIPAELISMTERLKIAIIGDFKTGKSWLAATAPKPVYIFDFDDRAESLAGKPGLRIEKKAVMQDVETALSVAKYHREAHLPNPCTWVFDTATYMQKSMEAEIFRLGSGMHREIKVGSNLSVKVRSGWDAINAIQRHMELLISEFSALGNIIWTFHEKNEKDYTKSTPSEQKFTGQITVDPQYLAKTLSLFNIVLRTYVDENNKFKVQCNQTYEFSASTPFFLDSIEEPDIEQMILKHKKREAEKKAQKSS